MILWTGYKFFTRFFFILLSAAWLLFGMHGFKTVPALEGIIDPLTGIWGNTKDYKKPNVTLNFLYENSEVIWNKENVPYIFAKSTQDLYRIQGYIVASQRLWQMEFLARVAAGRLSEVFGTATLEFDKFNRAISLSTAAETILSESMKDPLTKKALEAYSAGVNDYIKTLTPTTLPVEYKFFGKTPELWNPHKSALVYLNLAWQLSGYDARVELRRTNTFTRLGPERFENIFPNKRPWPHPMTNAFWSHKKKPHEVNHVKTEFIPIDKGFWPPPNIGSNAWAVRFNSKDGYKTILASDPHLPLSIPSIWFFNELSDNDHKVIGASIPGVPGVIIGSNSHYAWSVTNAGTDVVDWYRIKFKDNDWKEYEVDGAWMATSVRKEKIQVKGENKDVTLSITSTKHGPVSFGYKVSGEKIGLAMHWTGFVKANPFATFLKLNRSSDQNMFKTALQGLSTPLNFFYADKLGNIGAYTAGFIPIRSDSTVKLVKDGSQSSQDWNGFVPFNEAPKIENPEANHVYSANQDPVGENYPLYLGIFPPNYRARRIKELLLSKPLKELQTHQQMQLDEKCLEAEIVLPKLIRLISRKELSSTELILLNHVENWNYLATGKDFVPSIYEAWWRNFRQLAWKAEAGVEFALMEAPGTDLYASWLLQDRDSSLPNHIDPKQLIQHVTSAFHSGVTELTNKYGSDVLNWQWGKINEVDIPHISHIPHFGQKAPWVNGGLHSLNAFHKSYGPSLRLIVELDKNGPKLMAGLPGPQSGHPGDPMTSLSVVKFISGKMDPLIFAYKEADLELKNVIQSFRSAK